MSTHTTTHVAPRHRLEPVCSKHGGWWGTEATCIKCTDKNGAPRETETWIPEWLTAEDAKALFAEERAAAIRRSENDRL